MKKIASLIVVFFVAATSFSQDKVNPIIKDFGPVYEIPDAVEKPDPKMNYKLLVDLVMGSSKADTINLGIEAACTLLNLHGIGGVPKEKINMVMAVHNAAGYTVMNN